MPEDLFRSIRPFALLSFLIAASGCLALNFVTLGAFWAPEPVSAISAAIITVLIITSIMLGVGMILLGHRAASNPEDILRFRELASQMFASASESETDFRSEEHTSELQSL